MVAPRFKHILMRPLEKYPVGDFNADTESAKELVNMAWSKYMTGQPKPEPWGLALMALIRSGIVHREEIKPGPSVRW